MLKHALAIAAAVLTAQSGAALADPYVQGGHGAGIDKTSYERVSDVEIAIAARNCLVKGMAVYVVREDRKPVATTCIVDRL